jgi:hypothetical protein
MTGHDVLAYSYRSDVRQSPSVRHEGASDRHTQGRSASRREWYRVTLPDSLLMCDYSPPPSAGGLYMLRNIACFAAFFAVACSGSTFSPGVDGNKPINQLSDTELQTICMNIESQPSLKEEQCRSLGLVFAAVGAGPTTTDAELQATCATAYSQCENPAAAGDLDAGVTTTNSCNRPGASCTATVGQLSACINEIIAMPDPIPPCNQLTAAKLMTLTSAPSGSSLVMSGPVCKAYMAVCPNGGAMMTGASAM